LLLAEGHAEARRYAVAMVWSEARITRQRKAEDVRIQTIANQLAYASSNPFGDGKKANKALRDFLGGLDGY
jgi:hypothetical protein